MKRIDIDKKKLVLARRDLRPLTPLTTLTTEQLQQVAGASGYIGCGGGSSKTEY